jgi:hypothetical protein
VTILRNLLRFAVQFLDAIRTPNSIFFTWVNFNFWLCYWLQRDHTPSWERVNPPEAFSYNWKVVHTGCITQHNKSSALNLQPDKCRASRLKAEEVIMCCLIGLSHTWRRGRGINECRAMVEWWLAGENQRHLETNMLQCHLFRHDYHMTEPGARCGHLKMEGLVEVDRSI